MQWLNRVCRQGLQHRLTAADVSIAVGNATELTRETADVVLRSSDIAQLQPLIEIARTAQRTIVSNLLWAFG